MPNTKSAIRRTKRTQTQASVNRIRKSKYKSAIKKMSAYLDAQLMKIAKTGIVNKKTTSRKISRVTNKINNSKKK